MSPTGSLPRPAGPLAAIVGPTASGKSDLAMALARRMPVEILVADSRQVYRGMEIGTAKPDANARAAVPHHLVDLADPDHPVTVADWVARARDLLPKIAERGAIPLVVAGTGLYLTALVDGYEFARQPDSGQLRAQLAAELDATGLAPLLARLASLDPVQAAAVDARNPRRVLRALERTLAAGGASRPTATPYPGRVAMIGIARPREVLVARIEERARRMFDTGLVDEAADLLAAGYSPTLTAFSGHGYREAMDELAGRIDRETAVADTVRRTRQYARRQMTWYRADRRIVWLEAGERAANEPALVDEAGLVLRRLLL